MPIENWLTLLDFLPKGLSREAQAWVGAIGGGAIKERVDSGSHDRGLEAPHSGSSAEGKKTGNVDPPTSGLAGGRKPPQAQPKALGDELSYMSESDALFYRKLNEASGVLLSQGACVRESEGRCDRILCVSGCACCASYVPTCWVNESTQNNQGTHALATSPRGLKAAATSANAKRKNSARASASKLATGSSSGLLGAGCPL